MQKKCAVTTPQNLFHLQGPLEMSTSTSGRRATRWKGNNSVDAYIASTITDELERRRAEDKGTQRMLARSKAVITKQIDADLLDVAYTVKGTRKAVVEEVELLSWPEIEAASDGIEPMTELECATWYVDLFWLLKWHEKTTEEGLRSLALLQEKRKRRRRGAVKE